MALLEVEVQKLQFIKVCISWGKVKYTTLFKINCRTYYNTVTVLSSWQVSNHKIKSNDNNNSNDINIPSLR